jgi:SAM-dependent methyltransferase
LRHVHAFVNSARIELPIALPGILKHRLTRWARRILGDNRALARGYFEHVYRREDPYAVANDPEAARLRDAALAAIAGKHFHRALEIGGGEGILAARIADQVDDLLLVDLSERALRRARRRLSGKAHVHTARLDVVSEPLPGPFDLIVCSEVLIYMPPRGLPNVCDKILAALAEGGNLLLLHVRSIHDDDAGIEYKDIGARTVHGVFIDDLLTEVEVDEVYPMHRLTLLRKLSAPPEVAVSDAGNGAPGARETGGATTLSAG